MKTKTIQLSAHAQTMTLPVCEYICYKGSENERQCTNSASMEFRKKYYCMVHMKILKGVSKKTRHDKKKGDLDLNGR